MPNGDSSKNLTGELANTIVKPITTEVGQIGKEVGQSLGLGSNTTQDPQQDLLRKQKEARDRQNLLKYFADQQANERRYQQTQQIQDQQKIQVERKDLSEGQQKRFEQARKQQKFDTVKAAQTRVERKGRVAD